MPSFVPDHDYRREDIIDVLGEHRTEGSFLLGHDGVALIAKCGDSVDDPHLPDRSSLYWPGQAPAHIANEGVSTLVFVELDSGKLRFLGTGRPSSYRLEGPTVRDVRFVFRPPLSRVAWRELLGGGSVRTWRPVPLHLDEGEETTGHCSAWVSRRRETRRTGPAASTGSKRSKRASHVS